MYTQMLGDTCKHKAKVWCCVGFCRNGECVLKDHSVIFRKEYGGYESISNMIKELGGIINGSMESDHASQAKAKKLTGEVAQMTRTIATQKKRNRGSRYKRNKLGPKREGYDRTK